MEVIGSLFTSDGAKHTPGDVAGLRGEGDHSSQRRPERRRLEEAARARPDGVGGGDGDAGVPSAAPGGARRQNRSRGQD